MRPAPVRPTRFRRFLAVANGQYRLNKHYSLYASMNDIGGFVQNLERYAPNTPKYARGNRLQELGFYYTFGVRGTF